jgi:hypothetical protein
MHTADTPYAPEHSEHARVVKPRFKVLELIAGRRGGLVIAALALLLTLPSLRLGLMTDDRGFASRFHRGDGPLVVFSITDQELSSGRQLGMYPWWTSPNLQIHFLRPLTALTHELDYRLWPHAVWAMHLSNCVLYALIALLASGLYRELLPAQPLVAALAALMFAIDDGHATAAGWIASRSMLLASVLSLASMLLYVRARARRAPGAHARWLRLAAVSCFALSLAAAESGLATLAYLGAYALTFEKGHLVRRLATLLPELAVFAIWAAFYISGHYGAHGISMYRELNAPLTVLREGLLDLPAWLLILLGPSLVDSAVLQSLSVVRVIAALLCLPLLAALYVALPRTKEQRFFALGALACLPPMFTTLPQARLLIMASFGGFGILASFLTAVAQRLDPPRWLRVTRGTLIALHLVLSPLIFVPALGQLKLLDRPVFALTSAVPESSPRHVVLLNSPFELLNLYAWLTMFEEPQRKLPDTFAELYAGSAPVTVRRVDARTLELRPEQGWGRLPIERMLSKIADMPRPGTQLEVSAMEVVVQESAADGRPARVLFRFPTPLEHADWLFLAWQGRQPVPWQPPAVGEEVVLPALSLMNLIEL